MTTMFTDLLFRLRALFRRNSVEAELDAELRAHLQHEIAKHVSAGLSPIEAARRAHLALGGLEQIKEVCRQSRGTHFLETTLQDFRYALRTLRKAPAFTFIAILILALGIGSNTAVFSLIDALLLRSLAVPNPQELVRVSFGPPGNPGPLSGPMFDRLRERQSAFTDLFAWTNAPMVLTENGVARPIQAAYATGSAFPTLQLKPRLGRLLDWRDDDPTSGLAQFPAVISEAFWLEHFRGDPGVLAQTIVINGATAAIVGVMPRSFNGITVDYAPQVVLPFSFDLALRGKSSGRFRATSTWLFAMGRLKPGINYAQAQANLRVIAPQVLQESLPANYRRIDSLRDGALSLAPGRSGSSPLGETYGRTLWTLQALVVLLMISCCANLASLQLSHSLSRRQELVVRSALGADRLRLVRQLLTESTVLAIAGASAGILLSQWMSALLVGYIEQSDFPVFLDLRLNGTILVSTIVLAALTVTISGALPAISLTRFDREEMLRSGSQRTISRTSSPLSARLLPPQIALSLLLASLALLFAVSTSKLLRLDPGFRVKGVTLFSVDFAQRLEKHEARLALYDQMLAALRQTPGIQAASVLAIRPLSGGGLEQSTAPVEGHGPEDKHLFKNVVGPSYFAAVSTPILVGRDFSDADRLSASPVCIVNLAAAKSFFPQQIALGRHLRATDPANPHAICEIIAVVADAKYLSLRLPAPPTIYYSYLQLPDFDPGGFVTRSLDTPTAISAFNAALHRLAADTPLLPPVTMQRQIEDSIGQERLLAALSVFFGGLALLLTCTGLYGLESQRATQRTPEIGLRLALGAQKHQVLWLMLRESARFFRIGIPIGLLLTALASRWVANLLFNVSPLDPILYLFPVVALLSVGFLAAYLPARRAASVDPIVALRHD